LKIIAPEIKTLLSVLINESLIESNFPNCLKKASITPVHKKDSKLNVENNRPISLLSNIGKIYEKILHYRLYKLLETKNVLYKNQFGFCKRHNTTQATIALTEKIRAALDNNQFAVGIFVDLQKAFDTVDHKTLLKKIKPLWHQR